MVATTYFAGHVKRNPVNGYVAIRTVFNESDDEFRAVAWQVATPAVGAKYASTVEVDGWDDLFTAPDPSAGPG